MAKIKTPPMGRASGANDHGSGQQAVYASDYSEVFISDATLKELIVEALEDIQAESFVLAAAISMDVLDDWPGFREA